MGSQELDIPPDPGLEGSEGPQTLSGGQGVQIWVPKEGLGGVKIHGKCVHFLAYNVYIAMGVLKYPIFGPFGRKWRYLALNRVLDPNLGPNPPSGTTQTRTLLMGVLGE